MKKSAVIFLALTFLSIPVFAQFTEPGFSDWSQFMNKARSTDGAPAFVVIMLIVQGLYLILKTALGELLGHYKLMVLALLSVLTITGEKYLKGEPLINVFTDASTIMAYQVLAHQSVKHYKEVRHGKRKSEDSTDSNDDSNFELYNDDFEEGSLPFRKQG